MKKPSLCSSEIVYRGFFDIRKDRIMRSDGESFDYTCMVLPVDAAVVVAQTTDGFYITNREYRQPTGEWVLGCPGGRLEKGENPVQGGQRELFEETGYWSDEISIIGCCYPLPSLLDQKITFLHAKNAVLKSSQHLDPFEFIEIELKSEDELKKAIREGTHIDSVMCAALWYKFLAS
jgi:ADP-ribose pyrophosphatase